MWGVIRVIFMTDLGSLVGFGRDCFAGARANGLNTDRPGLILNRQWKFEQTVSNDSCQLYRSRCIALPRLARHRDGPIMLAKSIPGNPLHIVERITRIREC
jgi:hypothetical protein